MVPPASVWCAVKLPGSYSNCWEKIEQVQLSLGCYCGFLVSPADNHKWKCSACNSLRLLAAFEDGRWLMADGWWLMADGWWLMADGRWQKAIAGTLRLYGNQAFLREQPNYFRRTIIRPTIWRHSHAPTYSIYFALWLAKVSFAGNNV